MVLIENEKSMVGGENFPARWRQQMKKECHAAAHRNFSIFTVDCDTKSLINKLMRTVKKTAGGGAKGFDKRARIRNM